MNDLVDYQSAECLAGYGYVFSTIPLSFEADTDIIYELVNIYVSSNRKAFVLNRLIAFLLIHTKILDPEKVNISTEDVNERF